MAELVATGAEDAELTRAILVDAADFASAVDQLTWLGTALPASQAMRLPEARSPPLGFNRLDFSAQELTAIYGGTAKGKHSANPLLTDDANNSGG